MPYGGQPLNKYTYKSQKQTLQITRQILQALTWLHSRGMSHGDLKPSNIVVHPDTLKTTLIDYGSISFTSKYKQENQRCTLYYASPEEVLTSVPYPSNDIWSLGVTIFEHVTRESFIIQLLKFIEMDPVDISNLVQSCKSNVPGFDPVKLLQKVWKGIQYANVLALLQKKIKDRAMLDLISNCLLFDTKMRITAPKLLQCVNNSLDIVDDSQEWIYIDNTTHKEEVNPASFSSYDQAIHAGLDAENRKQFLLCYKNACERMTGMIHRPEQVLAHSVMCMDRYLFRTFRSSVYMSIEPLLICSLFISLAIHRGTYITFSMIKQVSPTWFDVESYLLHLIHHLDYKCFNWSPDMDILDYTKDTKEDIQNWNTNFLMVASMYPCIHSTSSLYKFSMTSVRK